jgi:hypothetical protein
VSEESSVKYCCCVCFCCFEIYLRREESTNGAPETFLRILGAAAVVDELPSMLLLVLIIPVQKERDG